ncbi:MAG TPA: radical SAM protein [Terriglobia bacterium]|nr:radical SAM protein [Terriglobia bacterium]
MLDITQLHGSLSMLAANETSKRGPHLEILSPEASPLPLVVGNPKPVVSWRVTRSCNLNCVNCLSDSRPRRYGSELTTPEGMALIRDLGAMQVPRLLFAGGEPLMRTDLVELVAYTRERGIQPSLLTNGTLLNRALAAGLKRAGLHTVSILLEGIGREVDRHRGVPGAFDAVLEGYANCEATGLAAEIRTPLNRWNYPELADILDFIERRRIRQVAFAHLVYAGRGNSPQDDLTHDEKRRALDLILERTEDFHRRGVGIKIATDENHVDGIYLYLRLARTNPRRAAAAYRLLQGSGANLRGAGVGLAGIDSVGDVHPDPYWANYVLGNVRETPFSEIWEKSSDPLLRGLRDRLPLLKGRCANCRWKQACGGNLRVRAEEFFGDPWMSDPACYLTDEEIGKEVKEQIEGLEDNVLLSEQAA